MAFLYPWGNTQQLNLDWILKKIKELETGGGAGADLEEIANALIALTHHSTTQYQRWDYCFYNGKLYRALVNTSGAFAPADWREVLLGDDVSVLTRLINALNTDNIDNASNVSGNTASDALNNLLTALGNLDSDDIDNASQVSGATVTDALDNLNGAITHIKNITSTSKALLIGDSYNYGSGGTQPYGWGYYLQQLSGATCDIVHQNGGGFTTPGASIATYPDKTYVQLVSDLDASKNYDFIIVQNGQNDGNHGSVSGINTAVPAFMTAIKAKYPNAIVWIIPVWDDSDIAEAKNDILKATAEQAVQNGARTCFNSWQWMVGTGTNSDYANHLTDDGYRLLAKYIYELVNGWSGEKNNLLKNYVDVYPINPSNNSIAARGQAYQYIYGNLSIFHGFFRCTSAVARTEVIYQLTSGYTYDTLSNVYITTATSDPTATVNLTAGGNVIVSNNDGLGTTPSAYPWNPYEIWLITNCRKNQ